MRRDRPRSVYTFMDNGEPGMTADQVIAADDEPEFSGLYDARGDKLYRQRERIPFGFRKGN